MMSLAVTNNHSFYLSDAVTSGLHSFGVDLENAYHATAQKIKKVMAFPLVQWAIGLGLGACVHKVYSPLTIRALKVLVGGASIGQSPFIDLAQEGNFYDTFNVCVFIPALEELFFRGLLQGAFKIAFKYLYAKAGLSDLTANIASRVTAIFFASIAFGLYHFSNALSFGCHPIIFLPQVIVATIMGLILGLVYEFSGSLQMPIGLHMGNNIFVWARYSMASL
ncbi:MAG: Metal-dependent rane protease, family [Chlamydiales bacterium]|jgi:membrane protease YdiL (CAAX protease family)|nr:Metal-dependent rane protease, family [Chlamydiales bacterium]